MLRDGEAVLCNTIPSNSSRSNFPQRLNSVASPSPRPTPSLNGGLNRILVETRTPGWDGPQTGRRDAAQPPAWTLANAIPQTHERRTASEPIAAWFVYLSISSKSVRKSRADPRARPYAALIGLTHLTNVVPDVQEARGGRHPDQTVHNLDEALDDGDVELPAREKESDYQPLRCAAQ